MHIVRHLLARASDGHALHGFLNVIESRSLC
jgi:hypothetical protein